MGRRRRVLGCAALIAGLLLINPWTPVQALSFGITTNSFGSNGCNECHSGGNEPTVTLSGPTVVAPGSINQYLLQISEVGLQDHGGLNVSALAGTLAVGGGNAGNTQVLVGTGGRDEITHTTPQMAEDNEITFSFLWTAPNASTTVSLDAWGNAVYRNFSTSGDMAAQDSLLVTVGDAGPPIDSYKCYQGKDLKDPKFAKSNVMLSDQFTTDETVEVQKLKFVCVPTSVSGTQIMDPDTHLMCYQIKAGALTPPPRVMVTTQLQPVTGSQLDLKKPKLLCVPGSKELLP